MKTKTTKTIGETEMKTSNTQTAAYKKQGIPSNELSNGEGEKPLDSRMEQIAQLARDGDEIAQAEMELYYALA